jgi:hypothetical protein
MNKKLFCMRKKNMQKYYFYYLFLLFTAIFIFQTHSNAQSITKSYTFPKLEVLQFDDGDKQVKTLTFKGANAMDEFPELPVLCDKIEVNRLYASYQYTLSNLKYQPLTQEESALIPAECTFVEPKVNIVTGSDAHKFYAVLSIFPVIKNASGQYQQLTSCDIRFEGNDPVIVPKKGLTPSVLASGNWYKIAVNSSGLHKVTYNDLKNLGINMSGLPSSTIALFGNGGGMLPDINPVEQIDDLIECPIMVVDNGSGVFNENSYFVFYAQGPHTWTYNQTTGKFSHNYNIYSDNAYYFINVDAGIGQKKRIETIDFSSQTVNGSATFYTYYDFYEKDIKNFGESGRRWFDEAFFASSTKTYSFTLPELFNNTARLVIKAVATSTLTSSMKITWGSHSETFTMVKNSGSFYAAETAFDKIVPASSGNVSLALQYNSAQNSAPAHLDYIEIEAKCKLNISGGAMRFAITENIGTDNISSITLGDATNQTKIWDVTDHNSVYALKGDLSGTQFSFKTPTDKQRTYIAFNGTSYKSVTTVGKVKNQDLHGFRDVNMVIVAHPDFLSEAKRLAQFRAKENDIKVEVVTPIQVYNEFSSGAQDPVAIRNFMSYLYDNDAQNIKYLLLFGRPSYDYRGRVSGTQLFVPNYQRNNTTQNISDIDSNDDFFGILGALNQTVVNIAVGRFPTSTSSQATIAVDKTIHASVRHKIATQNASQISNFGDWRNSITFVADDKDSSGHLDDADGAAQVVAEKYPRFNIDKIYSDAYKVVSYAGGQRYPEANKAINMRMERGTLAIAYFGHGGGNGWSHERILEISDINNWKNKYNQPLMITLTCSFGWYDKPAISPAELVFFNSHGGASALITTSRSTGSQGTYGKHLFSEMGSKVEGSYQTIGEIQRRAKNLAKVANGVIYLMGDPAMKINIPNQNVVTDQILGEDLQNIDTLKALTKVVVKGRVTDDLENTLSGFTGNIYPAIYDKAVTQKTLGQDPESPVREFIVQKNIIFKGNATVTNGHFEFSFFVPKDINFEYGNGKISYYAASANDDAGSYYDNFIIGGISDKPLVDDKGPEIAIFLNDEKFVPGGITNPNPVLILKLKDEYGINTTGNGIGHDLVAILDNNVEKQIVLNDFYLADQDSYNSGTVRYPLQNLAPGAHTLKVRAWDISNNPSEASIDFVVKTDEKLELAHVLNYPNPFTTKTSFYFEHNQPMETFDILVHIFTISGKLVKTIHATQFLEGNRSSAMEWDARDDFGDKIGKGVYLYRLTVRNSQGQTAEKIEKIAIL